MLYNAGRMLDAGFGAADCGFESSAACTTAYSLGDCG